MKSYRISVCDFIKVLPFTYEADFCDYTDATSQIICKFYSAGTSVACAGGSVTIGAGVFTGSSVTAGASVVTTGG